MRVFKEQQRFTQPWILVLLALATGVPFAFVLRNYFSEVHTFYITELFAAIGILCFALAFVFILKLTTSINETGIHYQFFPFQWRRHTLLWKDIKKAGIRTYNPIMEYGGWGYHKGFFLKNGSGTALNVSGNKGIQVILSDGKKLLIGTRQPEKAAKTLNHYLKKTI